MSRHRLGLVLTGGTIGSTSAREADVVRLVRGPNAGGIPGWLAGPLAAFGSHQLQIERPVELHSEEARPADWEAIAAAIRRLVSRGAEAICVLHGSDQVQIDQRHTAQHAPRVPTPVPRPGRAWPAPAPAPADVETGSGAPT